METAQIASTPHAWPTPDLPALLPMMRSCTAALAALYLLAGCANKPVPPNSDDPSLRALVERVRAKHRLPAVAVAIVSAEGILAAEGAGRRGSGESVRTDDRFMLGSVAKPITTTLLATLVEEGVLSWDRRVVDVLPELRHSIRPEYEGVTLRDLLQHRSGLPAMGAYFYPGLPVFKGSPAEQRYRYTAWLLRSKPAAEPGTRFSYSNGGYAVAGAMAERAAGQPLETLLQTRVFAPLGLASAGFDPPEWQHPDAPRGHAGLLRGSVDWMPDSYSARERGLHRAAGNVHMSVLDLARFLQLHLRGLRGDSTAVLNPGAIRALHVSRGEYAMGWVTEFDGRDSIRWHNGTDGRSRAYAALRPDRNLGIAILVNAGGDDAEEAYLELEAAILDRYPARGGVAER